MKERVVMDVYSCDSCNAEVRSPKNDITEAFGFHGTVQHITPAGGKGADWFACTSQHIEPAIFNALKRADS